MFKKLSNFFKKKETKEQEVVEEVELVEKIEEVEIEEEVGELPPLEPIEDEEASKQNMLRFQIYVGTDEIEDIHMVNAGVDFKSVDDAREFGKEKAFEIYGDTDDVFIFIHEHVKQENGDTALHRHY